MLTDIKYIGREDDDRGYEATICAEHNWREIAQYVYELECFECPVCAARDERERQERETWIEQVARSGHPSICLCNLCAPEEAEYARLDAEEAARLSLGQIFSPNYCNHTPIDDEWSEWSCGDEKYCRNAQCKYKRENPPF